MNIEECYLLLKSGKAEHGKEIEEFLKSKKTDATKKGNGAKANEIWCLEQINLIQEEYIEAYLHLKKAKEASNEFINDYDTPKSKEYEAAWNCLDHCDIAIGFLEQNYCLVDDISSFHVADILSDIQRLQPLFPYKCFLSREMIIKKQVCTICGEEVSIRHPCGHKAGKVYMGYLCRREIKECKLIAECIVSKPFDKYTILKMSGKKFEFDVLDYIVPYIRPYSKWFYTTEESLLPEYKKVGRNDLCPCGSGIKFKRCIEQNKGKHIKKHFRFIVNENRG